jgi:hypothetical protein
MEASGLNYEEFLEAVILKGIEAAKRDYANPRNQNHPMMLAGSVAGFEACRRRTPQQLLALLAVAEKRTIAARRADIDNYWEVRCYEAEIEWVCNCVSAGLRINLRPVWPTGRAVIMAAQILGIA